MLTIHKDVPPILDDDIRGILQEISTNLFGYCAGNGRHGTHIRPDGSRHHIPDDCRRKTVEL
jgi:hypothetical protein